MPVHNFVLKFQKPNVRSSGTASGDIDEPTGSDERSS
jgi:hypothetical protein